MNLKKFILIQKTKAIKAVFSEENYVPPQMQIESASMQVLLFIVSQ